MVLRGPGIEADLETEGAVVREDLDSRSEEEGVVEDSGEEGRETGFDFEGEEAAGIVVEAAVAAEAVDAQTVEDADISIALKKDNLTRQQSNLVRSEGRQHGNSPHGLRTQRN